jgi:predicted dinucleotide-binding enzyme
VPIDATNPFIEYSPKLVLAGLGGKGASEAVAALTPGARVVKAFNSTVTARFNEGPVKNGGRRVIFVSEGMERTGNACSVKAFGEPTEVL